MNTPRTDAFEKQRIVEATTNDIETEAWSDFARQLERDLAARNEAYDRVMNNHSVLLCERDSLRRQNESLREALREMIFYCPPKRGEWLNDEAFHKFQDVFNKAKALAAQLEEKTK